MRRLFYVQSIQDINKVISYPKTTLIRVNTYLLKVPATKEKKNEEKWQCKRKFYHRHQKRGVGSCHVRSVVGADDKSPVT